MIQHVKSRERAGDQREITGLPALAAASQPFEVLAPRSVRLKILIPNGTGYHGPLPVLARHGRDGGPSDCRRDRRADRPAPGPGRARTRRRGGRLRAARLPVPGMTELVDTETRRIIEECYEQALATLQGSRDQLA
jgi:hypothetical protein